MSVCLPLPLSGCAVFAKKIPLPEAPAYLSECAAEAPYSLPEGPYSRAETAEHFAGVRRSEIDKAQCSAQWRAYYDGISATRR